jgi:CRP/FNR family transcriptional regulator, cyclic AMP receptor protein
MNSNPSPELATMAALASSRSPRNVAAGEVIYRDGDPGDTLYGVVSGEIELSIGDTPIEVIGAGSSFGAAALLDPDHRRSGTATARGDASLLELNREEFLFAMQELPMFGLEVLHDLELRLQRLKGRFASL